MRLRYSLAAFFGAALFAAAPAAAETAPTAAPQQVRDQDRAYDSVRSGRSMPLPLIERAIVPKMRGYQYLGPELRGRVYRLKFVRAGRVVWVDVDPRSGRVVGTSGR